MASPGATMHGPAAEALLEGAEYDAETGDIAGASEAAAAGVRPPRPSNWGSMTKHQKVNWRRRNERRQDGMGIWRLGFTQAVGLLPESTEGESV